MQDAADEMMSSSEVVELQFRHMPTPAGHIDFEDSLTPAPMAQSVASVSVSVAPVAPAPTTAQSAFAHIAQQTSDMIPQHTSDTTPLPFARIDPDKLALMPNDVQTSELGKALFSRVCAFGPLYTAHAEKLVGWILDHFEAQGRGNDELFHLGDGSPLLPAVVAEAATALSICFPTPPRALPVAPTLPGGSYLHRCSIPHTPCP